MQKTSGSLQGSGRSSFLPVAKGKAERQRAALGKQQPTREKRGCRKQAQEGWGLFRTAQPLDRTHPDLILGSTTYSLYNGEQTA